MLLGRLNDDAVWETFPNLKRWVDEVRSRPAVQRGFDVGKEWRDRQRTPEEEERARAILFQSENASVRAAREAAAARSRPRSA